MELIKRLQIINLLNNQLESFGANVEYDRDGDLQIYCNDWETFEQCQDFLDFLEINHWYQDHFHVGEYTIFVHATDLFED